MRSYQITEFGMPLEARDYPTPAPRGTEVLMRVSACGVCHSDLHNGRAISISGTASGSRLSC